MALACSSFKRMTQYVCLSLFLISCGTATPASSQTEIVTVYASPAAEPWLVELFACANDLSTILNVTASAPDIYLRLGEPATLVLPAFQVDEEEILIVTHRESPVQNLSLGEAQALFTGQGDSTVQVWVYSSDTDVQIAFDQLVMNGRGVTSFARLAPSPQQMSDVLNAESNSVGILPRHWKSGNSREVFSAGPIPVLAVTRQEPQGAVATLLACLQAN
jgi:hypothetical protein